MAIIDQVRHNGDHGLEGHRVMVRKGFTIVELLIVIVVIGILAALVISTFSGAQGRARDADRKSDLAAIAKAIKVRSLNYDTVIRSGDTCTSNTTGFFNQSGTSLTGSTYGAKSAMTCLVEESGVKGVYNDPSGATSCVGGQPESCYVYLFYSCAQGTFIYAHLESEPMSSTATDATCETNYDTSWGMNYYVKAL